MATVQVLIPAFINFTYDGTELTIVDAQLSLKYENNSSYEEAMISSGMKGYMLRKGVTVDQSGAISIRVTKSADGKSDDTISKLESIAEEIQKSEKPDDYAKTITICIKNPGEDQFLSVSFTGYLNDFTMTPQQNNLFTDYIAEFKVFDPLTIKLDK